MEVCSFVVDFELAKRSSKLIWPTRSFPTTHGSTTKTLSDRMAIHSIERTLSVKRAGASHVKRWYQ